MKRKVNKKKSEFDDFEGKSKKHAAKKDKSSKRRLTIYDEFDDDDLDDYSSIYEDFDDGDDL